MAWLYTLVGKLPQSNCKKHTKSHEKPKQKQENQTQMFANKEIAKGKNGMR
jgi:hypothetical protein